MPSGQYGFDTSGLSVDETNSATKIWALILGALQNISVPAPVGGATSANQATQITAEQAIQAAVGPVTQHFFALAASGTHDIPAGAKEWSAAILTGTGTIGGVAVAAGVSDGSPKGTVGAITITTDSASTAYLRWGT